MRSRRVTLAPVLTAGALFAALAVAGLGGGAARAAVALDVTSSVTPSPMIVGEGATYTVTVANAGNSGATDVVTVITVSPADAITIRTLPSGCTASGNVVTCTAAAIAAGRSARFEIPVTVKPNVSDGTNVRLEATSHDAAGATGSAQPLITQAHTRTDVEITKTGPAEANPDGTITYTITVTNHGPSDAVSVTWHDETNGNLTSVDGYPCGNTGLTVSCTTGTLAPGQSRTYTITLTVRPDVADGTVIPNCAVVYTGTSPETNLDNNKSCINTIVTAPGQPAPTPPPSPLLELSKAAPAQVYEDGTIGYTITVTNKGPGEATAVRVNDPLDPALDPATLELPGGCTLSDSTVNCQADTLTAGESRTFEIRARARDSAKAGTNVINCGVATSPNVLVRIVAASCVQTHVIAKPSTGMIGVPPAPSADVSATKTAPAHVGRGGTIGYAITVANHGPGAAADVVVHDPVSLSLVTITSLPDACTAPSGTVTCQAGPLKPGETKTFTIAVRVNHGVGDRTVIENCADAYTPAEDPDIENNQSCAETVVGDQEPPTTSIVVTKDGPARVPPGGIVSYAITVANHGPADARDVIVRDPLDEPLITPTGLLPGCGTEDGTVVCTVGTLPAGESRAFHITAGVGVGTAAGTRIDNCAMAGSSATLLELTGQSACTEADVSGTPVPVVPVTG